MALLETTQDGLHVRVVVRIDLADSKNNICACSHERVYNREDDVRLRRELLEELEVLDGADGGLHAERLELLRFFWRAYKGGDLVRVRRRVFEEACKDGATEVSWRAGIGNCVEIVMSK